MANIDLGKTPNDEGDYYFISYKREDAPRIKEILSKFDDNIHVWYDQGVEIGNQYEEVILDHVENCKAMIMFISNNTFSKKNKRYFVRNEYDRANDFEKEILIVYLEDINVKEISNKAYVWYNDIKYTEGILKENYSNNDVLINLIYKKLGLELSKNREIIEMDHFHLVDNRCEEIDIKVKNNLQIEDGTSSLNAINFKLPLLGKSLPAIGSIITLGQHHGEKLQWRVLDQNTENGSILIITEKIIECNAFNKKLNFFIGVTWSKCDLRKVINGKEFISEIFKESSVILLDKTLETPSNPIYHTKGGNDTKDKMFLLSIEEVLRYFKNNQDRQCIKMDYLNEYNDGMRNQNEYSWWWLRSLGYGSSSAAFVTSLGDVYKSGCDVNNYQGGVRPACWIQIENGYKNL